MSDADIEKAIFAEYPDLAPKAGVVDRVKNSLTSSPAADYTADDLAASVATPSKDPNAVSLPGSVMDGFVPQANDQGMPIDSGMGPMRQDYYQRERAGLLSQSLQDNSKAIEAGGQRGKIAQQVVEDKVSRMERDMSGTGQARTPQEVMDDATQNRMPELQAGDATAGDALKDVGYAATRLPWAMAAGVPIVASAVHCVTEMLADRHNAWLCKAGEPRLAARRILTALETPGQARELAALARTQAYEVFSRQRMIRQYEIAYENLIAGRSIASGIDDAAMIR